MLLMLIVAAVEPLVLASGTSSIVYNLKKGFENAANSIVNTISDLLSCLEKVMVKLSEVFSIGLAIIGFFLWFSGVSPYSGKRMVLSAALLAIFAYILKLVVAT